MGRCYCGTGGYQYEHSHCMAEAVFWRVGLNLGIACLFSLLYYTRFCKLENLQQI